MINIVCVLRSGGKVGYDEGWVEKLQNSVTRNLTLPFKFVALSDCNVPCERIPLDDIGAGYWAKIQLFKPGLFTGPTLYLDLDTLICRNIDRLVENCLRQNKFLMWRDDTYNISSSAVMYWCGDYSSVYEKYINDPELYHERFSQENQGIERLIGDQALISTTIEHGFINDINPASWIKVIEKRNLQVDHKDTRILIFRKNHSKPSTMLDHPLVQKHWN